MISSHLARMHRIKSRGASMSSTLTFKKTFSPNFLAFNPKQIRQQRLANLGSTIDELKKLVPGMVQKSLPKHLISPKILLQFCPVHLNEINCCIPTIKGRTPYYGACKILQVAVTSLVSPNVKLHIQSIRLITKHETLSKDDIHSVPNISSHSSLPSNCIPYTIYPEANKILVKWTTSPLGGYHNENNNIPDGWEKMDTSKFKHKGQWRGLMSYLSNFKANSQDNDLERVVSGIFVFELNEDNDQILVHSIEDIDIIEKTEPALERQLTVC